MVDFDFFAWERKYNLEKYPTEPYLDLVVKQRNYPGRIAIMGAWKTGCLSAGNTNLAYLSLTKEPYSYTNRWIYDAPVARRSWEKISDLETQLRDRIPSVFPTFEPGIFQKIKSFDGIGFVYAAFVLHCISPTIYPLFDQHVFRAFRQLNHYQDSRVFSSGPTWDWDMYLQYKHFFEEMKAKYKEIEFWRIDRALWAYGKSLKSQSTNRIADSNKSSSRIDIPGEWVTSRTLGAKEKLFYWKIDNDGNLTIYRIFQSGEKYNTVTSQDLSRLNCYIKDAKWVPLANNVEKLNNGTEAAGLGTFLVNELRYPPADGQIASHLAALHYRAGIWDWNRKQKGMEFVHKKVDWKEALIEFYKKSLENKYT